MPHTREANERPRPSQSRRRGGRKPVRTAPSSSNQLVAYDDPDPALERRGGGRKPVRRAPSSSNQLVAYDDPDPALERRGGGRKPVRRAPSSSHQLVVYDDPDPARAQDRKVTSRLDKPPTRHGHRQRVSEEPKRKEGGPKIRKGDIRATYKVLSVVIGSGAFGTVRSCIHRESRTKLAIKSVAIKGNAANATLLKKEIALLQRVNHRNVVRAVDIVQDREYIHIVMEQCKGGDLFDMTVGKTRLGEGRIRKIVASLLDAVDYLHERNIVHRDLKAEHLMLFSNDMNSDIKIIDFGVATIHKPGDAPLNAFAGSARSIAPEVVKRSYGKECDLWSCGVITYFLLTRQMPFDAASNDPNEIFAKIVSGRFSYPEWAERGISEEAKDFINRLLVVNPKHRLTAKQALSHPWICNKKEKQRSRAEAKPLVSRQISRKMVRSRSQRH